MATMQKGVRKLTFGPVAIPWISTVAHGLNVAGGAVIPDVLAVIGARVDVGAGWESIPAGSVQVVAGPLQVQAILPHAGWSAPPVAAEVWVYVEKVHTIVGYPGLDPMPADPAPPYGGGGGPVVLPGPGRLFHVNGESGNDGNDGSPARPFATVTRGIQAAEALAPVPSMDDPAAVLVYPKSGGGYDETAILRFDGLHLLGVGGQGITKIRSTTGPSLIVTNATPASLAAFLGAGGQVDPNGNYGLLVADVSPVPRMVQIRDIDFGDWSAFGNTAMFLGVGAGTQFGGSEINLMRATIWGSAFARLVNYLSLQDDTWITGKLECWNCAGYWLNRSQVDAGVYGFYDTAADEPSDVGNYGLNGGAGSQIGNLFAGLQSGCGAIGLANLNIGAIFVADFAVLRLNQAFCGRFDCGPDASFSLSDVHVEGAISIGSGGAGGPCLMNGGRYMGALNDPGLRLVRNLGS